jgi:hypothetical protein
VREIWADLFVSLDGFAGADTAPAYCGYAGPELGRWIDHELTQPQELLLGRETALTLVGQQVLDGRLVLLDYRPAPSG